MIQKNLELVCSQLNPPTKLLAVSKTKPIEMIREAYAWGQRDFGENKVQDLWEKAHQLKDLAQIRWHFIGKLQSNKINKLLTTPYLYALHSVDQLTLVEKLIAKKTSNPLRLFLQINTSQETEKSGFSDNDELEQAVTLLQSRSDFLLTGLMTMGSIRSDDFEQAARHSFQQLADIKKQLDAQYQLNLELSMGMSQDYIWAMEYGSHWIRIGTQIFGQRT